MGAIAGFLVGYYIGTRDGNEGFQRLMDAWDYVSQNDEFKAAVASAATMAAGFLRQSRANPVAQMYPALAEGVIDLLARRRAA